MKYFKKYKIKVYTHTVNYRGQWEKYRAMGVSGIYALRQNCVEETLWSAIAAFQNYPFRTASGLPYQYKLKIGKDGTYNKELLIDRRENSKTLSWSSIKMAFQNCRQISGIVKRPKALGDIRGISYIYPLFWKFGLIEVPKETAKKMSGECDTEAEL